MQHKGHRNVIFKCSQLRFSEVHKAAMDQADRESLENQDLQDTEGPQDLKDMMAHQEIKE